ncbi:MAG: ABC transporter ATP-binding protein [Pseudomonadota bacterium]
MTARQAPSLVGYVWRHSRREQIVLLTLTLISFPVVYLSLEIPKIIVNDVIDGGSFPVTLLGVSLSQIEYLLALSGAFLATVVIHNGFKWLINVGLGMAGERLLRRMRYELADTVSRFPMKRLRVLRPGETIQSIMGEIEPLGGFFGEVIVTPVFQGGLLLVYLGFIFVQDVWLGLAAIAFYPVQTVLVPILQRRILRLNRQRAANARVLADRIGEIIETAPEIRAHATAPWHLAEIAGLLGANSRIRQAIFRRKFTIKFLNNFLNQLTPFLFYAIGGTLVIQGDLDFGALVAVLAAYKDLAGPWKALLGYGQRLSDFTSRYRFVLEGFQADDLMAAHDTAAQPTPAPPSRTEAQPGRGPLVLTGISADPAADRPALRHLSITAGERLVLSGARATGLESLLRIAAGIELSDGGTVTLGGQDLRDLPPVTAADAIGFVPASPRLATGSLRDNIAYALLRPPVGMPLPDFDAAPGSEPPDTAKAPGPDGAQWSRTATPEAAAALDVRIIDLAARLGLDQALQSVALERVLPPEEAEATAAVIVDLRARLAKADGADEGVLEGLVEPWDSGTVNANASLLANLLFALPATPGRAPEALLQDPSLRPILRRSGAEAFLLEIGLRIARSLAEVAASVGDSSRLLDRLGGFSRREILDSATIIRAFEASGRRSPKREDRPRLMALAAAFVPARDRLDVLDGPMRERLLAIRTGALPSIRRLESFVPLDAARYHPSLRVADNVLNGPRRHDRKSLWRRLDDRLIAAVAEQGLAERFLHLGLEASAGEAAQALPAQALRQIALMRVLLKRPSVVLIAGDGADLHPDATAGLLRLLASELPETAVVLASETPPALPETLLQGTDPGSETGSEPGSEMGLSIHRLAPARREDDEEDGRGEGTGDGAA